MNTSEQLVVNKLPTRTWNHLQVNEATIPWNVADTADLGTDSYAITAENQAQPLHIDLTGAAASLAADIRAEYQSLAPRKAASTSRSKWPPVCRQRCIWCWIRRTASPWKRR